MKEEREEKKRRRESGEYQDPRLQVYFQILVSSYLCIINQTKICHDGKGSTADIF